MSAIAKTASITLITAVPGSGKTLRAVWYAQQAIEAGEQVYACNVNGLNLDGVVDFPDPRQWEDLPAGSILIVDEAQKFFRAGREVPSYIAAMETIRHMGIRLILITQHPTLIHGNIRALVGHHEHLVRENGATTVTVYTRSRVIDNVRSDKALATEDHHKWSFPTECYDLYKSAEVHTVKRTIKSKYKRAAVMALLAACLVGFVVWRIKSNVMPPEEPLPAPLAASQQPAARASATTNAQPVIETAADYAKAFVPMVPEAPFTALAYVNRPVQSQPEVYCMSTGRMHGTLWIAESCTCLTEQGTEYMMDMQRCVERSQRGSVYNPYRAPAQDEMRTLENDPGAGGTPADMPAPAGALVGGGTGQQQAAYGGFRDASNASP